MPKFKPPFIFSPRYIEQKEPFELSVGSTISGRFKVQVCREGKVVREPFGDKFIPNVITNFGLDSLMTGTSWLSFLLLGCKIGSGTTTPAVTDTNLVTPLRATNTLTGLGSGTVNDTVNGAATHTQVFEFAAESGTVTYNEVGLSANTTLATANCYTRSLFPSGVVCNNGDNMRVTYQLTFSIPALITPITISQSAINGFNISGQLKAWSTFAYHFGVLTSSGSVSTNPTDANVRSSAIHPYFYLCSAPNNFGTVNVQPSATQLSSNPGNNTLSTYTNGTFTRNSTHIWVPSNPASTVSNVQGLQFGGNSSQTWNAGLYLLLTTQQTKANTNTLTVVLTGTIARA